MLVNTGFFCLMGASEGLARVFVARWYPLDAHIMGEWQKGYRL